MIRHRNPFILVTVATISIGVASYGQRSPQGGGQDRSDQSAQNSRQDAQHGQRADQQIDQLLMKIADDPKTAPDKLFILTAALHNQAELELAKEVAQKSQNEQVKKTAQNMVQRLQKTHDQLQQTAQSLGLQLPKDLGQAAVQQVAIIAALPSDQMDRQFAARAEADGAQDLSQYQSEAQIAQDPQIKQFARRQIQDAQDGCHDASQMSQAMGMNTDQAQPASENIPAKGGQNK